MVDPVLDALLNPQVAIPETQEFIQPAGPEGIFDFFTGETRTTPRVEAAQEIGVPFPAVPPFNMGKQIQLFTGLLATLDPEAQTNLVREVLPDAKIEQDEFGNTFIMTDGQEFILNKPGASLQDAFTTAFQIASFIPAARLGGFFARLLAGGATSLGLDIGAELLGAGGAAEPVEAGIRATIAGTAEAVLPPAGRALVAGGRRLVGRRAAPVGATPETAKIVEESLEAQRATGIELLPAQRGQIPRELERQRFIAELPGGSQQAAKALQKQNEQAFDATMEFFDATAPARAIETGQRRVRTAAQNAIERAKTIRSQKASPIFDAAFEDARVFGLKIDTKSVRDAIPLESFPKGGEIHRSLTKVQNLIKNAGDDLERLHNVKTEIDQMINKTGEGGLGPTTKRKLVGVQNQLIDTLENQSSTYAQARTVFREASPEVDALKDSIIGTVSKLDDTQLKSISQKLLDPAETNPQTVANAKRAIESVDPGAWSEMLRVEFERRLGGIRPTTTAAVENVPSQIVRALFGNVKSRKVLFAALPNGQKQTAQFLETALRRASTGRPGGSPTATRTEMMKELRGGVGLAIRDFLSAPAETAGQIGAEEILRQRIASVARIMFDPSYVSDIKSIQKLGGRKAFERMGELLTAVLTEETRATIQ